MKLYFDATVETQFGESFFLSITDQIAEFVEFEPDAELSVVLTDDETISGINFQYRGKDSPTDVLSFPMNEKLMLGDIVISVETAKKQADEAGITLYREAAFLFIHGFLHLLGFDHEKSLEDEREMYDLQEEILQAWESNR